MPPCLHGLALPSHASVLVAEMNHNSLIKVIVNIFSKINLYYMLNCYFLYFVACFVNDYCEDED